MIAYCEDCWRELPPRKQSGRDRRVCAECRTQRKHSYATESDAHRRRRLLAEALDELAPYGLTDDCPARRKAAA